MIAATTTATSRDRAGYVGPGRQWRGLGWNTWRQHRTIYLFVIGAIILAAVLMAATGPALHGFPSVRSSGSLFSAHYDSRAVHICLEAVLALLVLSPVLAGVFLGAPLVASEAEHGTTKVAWTQGMSRQKWFAAQVIPVAVLLALAGAGLGLEFRWWAHPLGFEEWNPSLFSLNPLPLAAWMTGGFSLGVLLGGAIRRTVAAMAATAACCGALMFVVAAFWRNNYLPPLIRITAAYGNGAIFSGALTRSPGPEIVGSTYRWPDGRLVSDADLNKLATWHTANHIQLWFSYQPASRFGLFELIEFGWLIAFSAILIGAAAVLIRRRAA